MPLSGPQMALLGVRERGKLKDRWVWLSVHKGKKTQDTTHLCAFPIEPELPREQSDYDHLPVGYLGSLLACLDLDHAFYSSFLSQCFGDPCLSLSTPTTSYVEQLSLARYSETVLAPFSPYLATHLSLPR